MPEILSPVDGQDWKVPTKDVEKVDAPAKFFEASTVNGIQFNVGWNEMYDDYTIHFPQIDLNEGDERGVYDRSIRLTRRPEVAKQIYDKAVELAKTIPDVYELYKRIGALQGELPYDTDEE